MNPESPEGRFLNTSISSKLDALMGTQRSSGVRFWRARDLMPILGYERWENFLGAIEKAKISCQESGLPVFQQFRDATKVLTVGNGATIEVEDFFLTRYACYLVAMNGDSRKPEIAAAQTYFAIQTRRQELEDSLTADEKRVELRERVRDANRKLNGVAKSAGVQKFGVFNDAGYKGLYGGLGVSDVKRKKGISSGDDLLDCAGRAELAANEFRITQTEQKLVREAVKGETSAINTHFRVGKEVRKAIENLGGTMPEELPKEPSIKRIIAKRKRQKHIDDSSGQGQILPD